MLVRSSTRSQINLVGLKESTSTLPTDVWRQQCDGGHVDNKAYGQDDYNWMEEHNSRHEDSGWIDRVVTTAVVD